MKDIHLRALALPDIMQIKTWPPYESVADAWANLPVQTAAEAEQWLKEHHNPPDSYSLVVESNSGILLGRCNLAFLDKQTGVGGLFSFVIRRDQAGKGIGQAALELLLQFAFLDLHMTAVYLYTGASNRKARYIYEKNSFQFMGSHYDFREGQGYIKFVDLVAWRETWLKNQEQLK